MKTVRVFLVALILALSGLASSTGLRAQSVTAELSGQVTDTSGGSVAKATVTAVKHANLADRRVIAFATHGLLAGDVGIAEPGLVMTPPVDPTTEDDGLLKASEIAQLKLNADLADTDFAYTLPPNAKEMQMPDYDAKLVPVGKQVPVFDLLKPNGGKVTLTSALKGKKAVLVNFWFYG